MAGYRFHAQRLHKDKSCCAAQAFGVEQRKVGIPDQLQRFQRMQRRHGNTTARRHPHCMGVDPDGFRHAVDDQLCDGVRLFRRIYLQQQAKLVAANAGNQAP
jgi:hypothetical protein